MREITNADVTDIKLQRMENFRDIKLKKEMTVKECNGVVKEEFDKTAKEAKSLGIDTELPVAEKNLDPSHKDCLTTSEMRKEFANGSRGDWNGEPGGSKFYPEKAEAKEALKKYRQDGIKYHDGEPDFSRVSEITAQIKNMTSSRPQNFKQADKACAKQWNEEARDNRTDWSLRKVEEWRLENRYSWHERLDRKTMDLVQRDVHEECKHYGGVAECRKHEIINGGNFDE